MIQVLYNLRTSDLGYRVTKFTDGEVESSYLTSDQACDCPAGHRATCRHRQMLPNLLPIADTQWFLDYDAREVVDLMGTPKVIVDAMMNSAAKIMNEPYAPAEQDTEPSVPAGPHVEEDKYLKGIRERWPAGQHTAAEGLPPEETVQSTSWRRL